MLSKLRARPSIQLAGTYQECETALREHCKLNPADAYTYKVYPLVSQQLVPVADRHLTPSLIMETADATFMEELRNRRIRIGAPPEGVPRETLRILLRYGTKYRKALDDLAHNF